MVVEDGICKGIAREVSQRHMLVKRWTMGGVGTHSPDRSLTKI